MEDLIEKPSGSTPFELADWVELNMVLQDLSSVSRTTIVSLFASGQAPDGAELDELFAEIRRRASIAPSVYPFRAPANSIHLDRVVDARIYRLLLALSVESAPFRKESRYGEVNPIFELVTREALLSYMGGGEARRFGWPNGDGRPEHLADAVEWLAAEMGVPVGVVRDEVDEDDKDGGIDVAAWRPFADRASSFSVYLAQCTVQATYERKPADVEPKKWTAWIQIGRDPEIVLSIPYAIPPNAKVRSQLKYRANVLLDRLRICEMLESSNNLNKFPEYDAMKGWADKEIQRTKDELTAGSKRKPRMAKTRKPLKPVKHVLPGEPVTV